MKALNIESSYFTPRVEYNPEKGVLEIEGRALETDKGDNNDVFSRISDWMNDYLKEKREPILIKFRLTYYNTTSSKKMVKFMKSMDDLFQKGHDIKIEWEYEDADEDGLIDGEAYKKLFGIPFILTKF